VETAVQWIYNHIRYVVRAKRARPRTKLGRERLASVMETEWVEMCWDVGHSLTMMQAHGIPFAPVIDAVSSRLMVEFPDLVDLQAGGLQRMRRFYLDYFERPDLLPRLRMVSWGCHLLIQERCRDPMQQEFYLEMCIRKKWTPEDLAKALESRSYELSAAPAAEDTVSPGVSGESEGSEVFPIQGS
jgi:hypothetical protein